MKTKKHKRNQIDILQMEYIVVEKRKRKENKMAEGTQSRST